MDYLAVNWLAIVVAMVASMALGMAWYMTLSRPWMAAADLTPEDVGGSDPSPYIWSAVCQLVIAYFIAVLTVPLTGAMTPLNAALVGAQMWLAFIVTSMITNHRYQGSKWSLTAIDGGYFLGVVVVQGLVIGLFG